MRVQPLGTTRVIDREIELSACRNGAAEVAYRVTVTEDPAPDSPYDGLIVASLIFAVKSEALFTYNALVETAMHYAETPFD